MRNDAYWNNRMRILEESLLDTGYEYVTNLERQYDIAIRDIEGQIATWYQRFARDNAISLAEARRLLSGNELKEFRWTVEEYIKHGEQNAISQAWLKQLKNASAKVHISRLDSLKIQLQQQAEMLYGNQLDGIDKLASKIYSEGYYHTAFEVQKGIGVGWSMHGLTDTAIRKVISRPWTLDGQTFSNRIWNNKQGLVSTVNTQLTQMLMRGTASDKAIKTISERFRVSKSQAGRLVMTESAAFSNIARKDCFADLGVEEFVVVETLDNETCSLCGELDGKVFPMGEYAVGVTVPPFHPWCRGTTAPYFKDLEGLTERAARGADGKTYYVPGNMNYKEWKKRFVDGGDKSGLSDIKYDDTIKKKLEIKELNKLKQSGMSDMEYNEYLNIINNHSNEDVIRLYNEYADEIKRITLKSNGGVYQPASATLDFSYPKYADMNKYGTLAHEYGHFFDDNVNFDGLHFEEIEAVRKATGSDVLFKSVASSSDEFLAAIRNDKAHIKEIFTADIKADLLAHNASSGVQDAIDGLFTKSRLCWGHGERYYNHKYSTIEYLDKMIGGTRKKNLQHVYKDLGLDASNQEKTKSICRQYEAASEAWANIMSAEVCGGESLEYVKKYLPNSYQAMLVILKGVKVNE